MCGEATLHRPIIGAFDSATNAYRDRLYQKHRERL